MNPFLPNNLRQKGFTLIELMMVIAIIGILASMAIPAYTDFMQKSRYTEMVTAVNPARKGVDTCFQVTGSLTGCVGGRNGVPPNLINSSAGLVRYIVTSGNGQIIALPNEVNNFSLLTDYLTLVPTNNNGVLEWTFGGPALTKGYVTN